MFAFPSLPVSLETLNYDDFILSVVLNSCIRAGMARLSDRERNSEVIAVVKTLRQSECVIPPSHLIQCFLSLEKFKCNSYKIFK